MVRFFLYLLFSAILCTFWGCKSELADMPCSAVVQGRVLGYNGRGLSNVLVSVSRVSEYSAYTNKDGYFEIDLGDISSYRQRLYVLSVDVQDYELYEWEFFFKENGVQKVDIQLSPLGTDGWCDLPKFQFGGYSYWVYDDLGIMSWYDAMKVCDTLSAYGFDDWKLPSPNELNAMFLRKDLIGGWASAITKCYWTNQTENFNTCVYQSFDENGNIGYALKEEKARVRPVRRIR